MFKTKNQRDALAHKSAANAYNELKKAEQTYNSRIEKLTQECATLDHEIRVLMQQKKQSSAVLKLRERKIIERRKDTIERIRLNILTARIQLESQWDTLPAKEALSKFIDAQKQLLSQSQLKTIESLIENLDATNRQYEEMEDRTTELFAVSAPSSLDFSEDDLENELAQLMISNETGITTATAIPSPQTEKPTSTTTTTASSPLQIKDDEDEYQKLLYLEQALPSAVSTGDDVSNNSIYIQRQQQQQQQDTRTMVSEKVASPPYVTTLSSSSSSSLQQESSTKDILSELEEC